MPDILHYPLPPHVHTTRHTCSHVNTHIHRDRERKRERDREAVREGEIPRDGGNGETKIRLSEHVPFPSGPHLAYIGAFCVPYSQRVHDTHRSSCLSSCMYIHQIKHSIKEVLCAPCALLYDSHIIQ